jgi:cytochrome P450
MQFDVLIVPKHILFLFEFSMFFRPQTANSTQWILYLLARHPNLQDELYAELQQARSSDDIVQLPLLRGTIREALRLYPVAPFLTRYLPEDSLIGGYHVPAGVSTGC